MLYFKETGINPLSRDKSTSEELAKLRFTIIFFIREQEKTKLLPLIEQVNEISLTIVHCFNEDAVQKSDLETLLQKLQPSLPKIAVSGESNYIKLAAENKISIPDNVRVPWAGT